jgi:hypothetical protein
VIVRVACVAAVVMSKSPSRPITDVITKSQVH